MLKYRGAVFADFANLCYHFAVPNEEIIDQIKPALAREKGVGWAYLYGSCLTSEKFDDVDVAVYLNPAYLPPADALLKLEQELGARLEKRLAPRREIDLKIINYAPIQFQYKIIKNGKLIYFHDPAAVVRFEGKLISAYLDYKPTLRLFEQALLERIGRW